MLSGDQDGFGLTACLLTGDVTSNISLGPELQLSNVKGGGGSDSYDYFSCNT